MESVDFPLYVFHHGQNFKAYEFFGAHPLKSGKEKGYIFRVWAPHAESVSVVGDFNEWNPQAHKMTRLLDGETFELFIGGIKEYCIYKYCIQTKDGRCLYKADPYAFHAETPSKTASKTYNLEGFRWGDREYLNEDPEGAYFVMDMTLSSGSDTPRVYFIGDKDVDGDGVEEHNVVLSYEYNMISNWAGHYVRYSGDVFGFYVPGKARYAVFCFKGSGYVSFTEPTLYVQERSLFEENIDSNMTGENALKDVSFKTDCFAFRSDYDVPELVVTVLGYDAGWSLSGTNGEETVSPNIYKLDGGLVGFVLPSGEWNWTLRYRTPGLSLEVGLAMGGVAALGVYFLGAFLYRQKENERLLNEPPAESTNSGRA